MIGILTDSKLANIPLMKISSYYKGNVDWYYELNHYNYDKIYYSKIFNFTKKLDREDDMIVGGTGHNLTTTLPDDIENCDLDYSIYPECDYSMQFLSRGCIRKCKFCVVPEKEGYVHPVGDLLDLWDGKSKLITVLDNNILALPKHFKKICHQAQENKIKLDFSQGLDHRLLTADLAKVLKNIRHVEYRFSFDHPSYVKTVEKAINILKEQGIKRSQWYVLVGFDTTFEEDLFRLDFLRDLGQVVYVMRYSRERIYIPLARWANQAHIFRAMDWKSFLEHKENKRYRKLFK